MARTRRARKRNRSSVASSAQCTSSMTPTVGRTARELFQQQAEYALAGGAVLQEHAEVAAELPREVEQRSKRTRGEQRVAGAAEHPASPGVRIAEGLNQSGFADSGLAADQNDRSDPVERQSEQLTKFLQKGLPLEQRHGVESLLRGA